MRCRSCDCQLTDFEATRKSTTTGEYLDLCNKCFHPIADEVDVIEREDLRHVSDDMYDENYEGNEYDSDY